MAIGTLLVALFIGAVSAGAAAIDAAALALPVFVVVFIIHVGVLLDCMQKSFSEGSLSKWRTDIPLLKREER
jgi:hypothetical protein